MIYATQTPFAFHWPAAATFGRIVPKARLYQHGSVRSAVREQFAGDVERITWAYKLSDDTIRLRGNVAVPEIQVFTVDAKGADVSDDVLTAIDKAVHFPIVFEVTGGGRMRTVAAQKTLGGKIPTVSAYQSTGWLDADADRRPLPTALDLPGLYEAILSALLPVDTRAGEAVSAAADRLNRARTIHREITALERKLRTEVQLNRKIEIRRQINYRAAALNELIFPSPSTKE